MAIEDGIFTVAVILDVLVGIACVIVYLRMKRERESHLRQLSILYNAYMKALDRLKNAKTSEEGHVVNPAFDMLASGRKKDDDLEAGFDADASDGLRRQTTVEMIQDSTRASLSPWNAFGGANAGRQGKIATRGSVHAQRSNKNAGESESEESESEESDDDDDAPPGLSKV